MEIRIHIPRPLLTLTLIAVAALTWKGVIIFRSTTADLQSDATGGVRASTVITTASADIDRERVNQAVLDKREEILRFQVQVLEDQALTERAPEKLRALADTRAVLLSIIKQRANSEKLLQLSLQQLWEAEGTTYADSTAVASLHLSWPAEPLLGLSARFEDASYFKRFGIPHHAIDIPIPQGSPLRAARTGKVLKVAMNGLGYSYIVLSHAGGVETIYGHISAATVNEGDVVNVGETIAFSGGQPGTPGAGLLTTGPHLHFAVRLDGALIDPLPSLPKMGDN